MKILDIQQRITYLSLSLILILTTVSSVQSQSQSNITTVCPFNHLKVPAGLKIRSVKVRGRAGTDELEKKLQAMFGKKDYSRDLLDQAMVEVETALSNEANASFEKQIGIIGGARAGAIYMKPCVEIDTTSQSIDFIINVLFIRADPISIANNILPIPRSLKPSFYDNMPAPLRVFNPQFNFDFDRKEGAVAALDISTNLLELSNLWKGKETSDPKYKLEFKFTGRKSFTKQFYQTKTDLIFSKVQTGKFVEKIDFSASFRADDQPLNDMRYVNHGLQFGGQIKLRPRLGLLNTVYLSGTYSNNNSNRVYKQSQRISDNRDKKIGFRSLIDGMIWKGFARIGVWLESTELNNNSDNYQRLAGLFGYQKEFGKGTQTVGFEALVGGGKSWGEVPGYARFFGGNNTGNFLYESPASIAMTSFPVGPLLRSYGKTQAALASQNGITLGGNSYWHANFNLTIPIRPWSRRLIPDETIRYDDGTSIKLNKLLENFTINTAIGGIGDDLLDSIIEDLMKKNPALDEAEAERLAVPIAQKQAEKVIGREIAPSIRFISRHANLFAVKPLIMLDAAKINGENLSGRYRFAAGGGLQFVIVLARAEIGYMRSLPGITGEPKGNFVFRITFQNLF